MMAGSIERLSSGMRINSAADDAAGLAVSEGLRAQTKGFEQAARNANQGIAMLQTADSAQQSISDTLIRMRELAEKRVTEGQSLGPEYYRMARIWFWLGIPAFGAMVAVVWLMVFKTV